MTYTFEAINQDGISISTKDFDQALIVYFYPRAMTSGCTKQALMFKEHYTTLKHHGYEVLGISIDEPKKLKAFQEKYDLPFTLLSDPEHQLCELFDTWKEKNMYGRLYMGIERSTFVLNPQREIIHQWRKVQVSKHWAHLKKALELE